jgi:hypothetical protein
MSVPRGRAAPAVALAVGGCFFALAGDGIRAYFTPDDMMNLYGAWSSSPLAADRPVGALFYRSFFALFGLHPLPYRLAAFALLAANLALLYGFCARLARSREVAALACLLGAYQAYLADLYYSTGAIYDLLCYFFFFLTLVWYLRIRDAGGLPDWRQTGGLLGLYALALGSKEMAVTFPVLLVAYECIYHRASGWRQWRFVWLGLPLTGLYALHKTLGGRRMTANPYYALHLTAHAYLSSWKHYLDVLFYGAVRFSTINLVLLLAAMLALAALARRRDLLFAWCFICVAMLPVVFIAPRGLFAVYMTLPGWYLFASGALTLGRDGLMRWFPRFAAAFRVRPEQAALFLLVAAFLIPAHLRERPVGKVWVPETYAAVRNVIAPLMARYPTMPRGAKVLFLEDPYPKEEWMLTFIFRLVYRDDQIRVDRAKVSPELAQEPNRSQYQRVFVLDEKGLREADGTKSVLH